MSKQKIFFSLAITTLNFLVLHGMEPTESMQGMRLSQIQCGAGSVLPFFYKNGDRYVILSREGSGCDKGTYDDFSGGFETCDKHPVITASREFWEEAILEHTVGLSQKATREYIDQNNKSTEIINAFKSKGANPKFLVSYITDFTPYADQLINNFYTARKRSDLKRSQKEKDSLALVKWDILKKTIAATHHGDVYVAAEVLYPNGAKKEEKIQLRRVFSSKMRLFFQEKVYQQGAHQKVRFYSYDFLKALECKER